MLRAHRFQLRFKPHQEAQLGRFSGMARRVWNRALGEQLARHERSEKYANYVAMWQRLTTWQNNPETNRLSEIPVHSQQQTLRRLDEAYQRFFARVKAGQTSGFPRFKRLGEDPGLRFPDPKQFKLDVPDGRLHLLKVGWLRLRLSKVVIGARKNASLTREGSDWFCAIEVEVADVAPTLGIDLGLTAFAGTSDGRLVEPLKAMSRQQVRLRQHQRSVSRKVEGSCNRKKALARLAALHRRIARQHADWLHKLTSKLASQRPVIVIEDLRGAAMSASAEGPVKRPGKNVRQKASINRGILDAAWAEFRRQIAAVNPAYTSRTCRLCGHEAAKNRVSQARFQCVACGHAERADVHAAKNILPAGYAVWLSEKTAHACGWVVRHRSARKRVTGAASSKQESSEVNAHG